MTLPCSHLDEFFDGELATGDATAFRTHLATCDACQRQLRGRMQEAMVVGEAEPAVEIIPIARAQARERTRANTRAIAIGGTIIAIAAAVTLVLALRGRSPRTQQFAFKSSIERAQTNYMSADAAHVGDILHLDTADAVWIFRDDQELVLACPGGPTCRVTGADLKIVSHGSYSIVLLEGGSLPTPTGHLDSDLDSAKHNGVFYKIVPLEVR